MRGFFTDPSRADDCFIPFSSGAKYEYGIIEPLTTKELSISKCKKITILKNFDDSYAICTISGTVVNSSSLGGSYQSFGLFSCSKEENFNDGTTITIQNESGSVNAGYFIIYE